MNERQMKMAATLGDLAAGYLQAERMQAEGLRMMAKGMGLYAVAADLRSAGSAAMVEVLSELLDEVKK